MVLGWKSEYKLTCNKTTLHLFSLFPLAFVNFVSDAVYIHHPALDVPLQKPSFKEKAYLTP